MRRPAFFAVACVAVVLARASAEPGGQAVDATVVMSRLHAYLRQYESDLSTVIAEERLTQWPKRSMGAMRSSANARVIQSDVAFVPLPGNAGWLGYRDVRAVNRTPVKRSGASLETLLKANSVDARDRAMALLRESARHNLGAPRTINLPSLPLELLHPRNRAQFTLDHTSNERVDDCPLRLDLVETVTPTLIQRPEGGNMPSRVAAWVEPASGRLCRAEVRTRDAQLGAWFEATVRVVFRHDQTLDLMVPVSMSEVFFNPPSSYGEGEAVYSNYRRFTTSARLVP